MRFLALYLALCAIPAVGQTFTLGTSSDPCTGGQPLTIANSTSTVRFGDFTCTFPVSADGLFTVLLTFLEPCAAAGACAGGQVTAAGQRVENVYANDAPCVLLFDPFVAGATDSSVAGRASLIYSVGGKIVVRVQSVTRTAVLAAVVIMPARLDGIGSISVR